MNKKHFVNKNKNKNGIENNFGSWKTLKNNFKIKY